ncbi:MAG: P1 family peptidase [Desulfarculales bacterium]|jgi:L-aminopeptidase/D-esterase-like protein|nr:P1 family peptidase [Desulfarculales bacterium]
MNITLTDIPGILVGHATAQGTGCTAVLCPEGLVPGVAVPGLAPGSRETDMMRAHSSVGEIHGICLAGGSSMGLAAAGGVARYLFRQGHGLVTARGRVPIVPAAVIYDFFSNRQPGILPDEDMGCQAAASANDTPVLSGAYGAGAGAACGMLAGRPCPSGMGSAGLKHGQALVAVLAVNNALGNIHDPLNGVFLAGAADEDGLPLGEEALREALSRDIFTPGQHTTLILLATNARLDKSGASRLAAMAYAGVARTVRPSGLTLDGDIVFVLAQKDGPAIRESLLGHMAQQAVAQALVNSVSQRPG